MKPKLTPWHPMTTDPANEGVYEIKNLFGEKRYSLWADRNWHLLAPSVQSAEVGFQRSYDCYSGSATGWRGLSAQGAQR